MWAKNKQIEELNLADSTSFFAKGFKITGNIDANNDVRIDGTVKGNITTTKKVIIGATGSVIGNVDATNISLMGEISGDLKISGLAMIGYTAKINGTITAEKLQIEAGAIIEAEIKRFNSPSKNLSQTNPVMKGMKKMVDEIDNYPMAKAL